MDPLPIDAHLAAIAATVRARRALVLTAPPGAGKTTRVPPVLVEDGPLILLQPRRVAARALARRIAAERGWTIGEEIGWQVRFERRFSPRTRLLVATEGILTARLLEDPLLESFRTIVLDEFHERSLHADLALALARQAFLARDDLRVVVMSATLDTGPVAEFLGGAPVLEVPGRPHPVAMEHRPGLPLAAAVAAVLQRGGGHVLCFLPGAPEIRRAREEIAARLGAGDPGASPAAGAAVGPLLLPLHGSLDPAEQEAALAPSKRRKVILATNIAETSLTVDGVTDVIDTGLHKILRNDPDRGLDRLVTERIPLDAALQRAGRAGRTGPGRVMRLWDAAEILRPRREPEIARVDLAGALLDVLAWGAEARRFEWFEAPPPERIAAALDLLEALGAVRGGKVTALGRTLRRFPLHPRLARLLEAAGGSRTAAACCAVISEEWVPPRGAGAPDTTASDLLTRVDRLLEAPGRVRQAAAELQRIAGRLIEGAKPRDDDTAMRRAILDAWPDRVARRRDPGSDRFVLASGHGASLGRESGVRTGEFVAALDVVAASNRSGAAEALIRMASRVEAEWIVPTRRETAHLLDEASGKVRASERSFYRDLLLRESPVPPDPAVAGEILAEAALRRGPGRDETGLLRRLRFAEIDADLADLVRRACSGRTEMPAALDLAAHLPAAAVRSMARLAPETIPLPSGRSARLEYREDGGVAAAVKLQELFGLAETPRLGPRREPVVFELLAPNGRPVQTTRDLRSFWEKTYPEVRKELRGRYPRHPWPEDPWTATPTHRTTRRPKR